MPESAENMEMDNQESKPDQELDSQDNQEPNDENHDSDEQESNDDQENSEEDDLPLPEPDADDESGDDDDEDDDEQQEASSKGKKKKEMPEWMKKKLERERQREAEKEAEAKALKEELDRYKRGEVKPQENKANPYPDLPMPKRDDFGNESEYFLALQDYRDEVRGRQVRDIKQREAMEKASKEYHDNLEATVEAGQKKYKDFDDRVEYILHGEGFPSNIAMGVAIVDSPYREDILYFLGTHLKEAERIANLDPVRAGKEIQKIENRFEARKRSGRTKAKQPLTPLGSNKGNKGTADPGKMNQQDFKQWYADRYSR